MYNHLNRVAGPGRARILIAWAIVTGVCAVVLTGCANRASTVAKQVSVFSSHRYAVAIRYPSNYSAARGFTGGYLTPPRWNPAVPASVPGRALLSLALPGSNRVRRAVLRLGASDDPRAVATCMQFQPAAALQSSGKRRIDGVLFHWHQSSDAAMSHYRQIREYRAVHADRCYAVDLIVAGTRRGVYDNPPPLPFSMANAMIRLRSLLSGIDLGSGGPTDP